MEALAQMPGITKNELAHAQQCQLYLGVTTVADICTSHGHSICAWALNGQEIPRKTQFTFPTQTKPTSMEDMAMPNTTQLLQWHQ